MFRPSSKPEKLAGRIRDIDRELRELRKAMRELERTGRTNYVPPVPRVRRMIPAAAAEPAEVAPSGRSILPDDAPVEFPQAAEPPRPTPPPAGDFFETGLGEDDPGARGADSLPYPPWQRPFAAKPPVPEPGTSDEKRRFANYFSSGFLPGKPLRAERHIQRNRAIAMIVVVVGLAFILYRVLR